MSEVELVDRSHLRGIKQVKHAQLGSFGPTIDVASRTRPHTILNYNSIVSTGKEDIETSVCSTRQTTHFFGITTGAAVCGQDHIERLSFNFFVVH